MCLVLISYNIYKNRSSLRTPGWVWFSKVSAQEISNLTAEFFSLIKCNCVWYRSSKYVFVADVSKWIVLLQFHMYGQRMLFHVHVDRCTIYSIAISIKALFNRLIHVQILSIEFSLSQHKVYFPDIFPYSDWLYFTSFLSCQYAQTQMTHTVWTHFRTGRLCAIEGRRIRSCWVGWRSSHNYHMWWSNRQLTFEAAYFAANLP